MISPCSKRDTVTYFLPFYNVSKPICSRVEYYARKKKKERFTNQTYTRNYLVRFLWNKVETKTFVLDELKISQKNSTHSTASKYLIIVSRRRNFPLENEF